MRHGQNSVKYIVYMCFDDLMRIDRNYGRLKTY